MAILKKVEKRWDEWWEKLTKVKKEVKKEGDPLGTPLKTNVMEYQKTHGSMEESYFWVLDFIRNPNALNYQTIDKVSDVFSATESSEYFGAIEQRKGAQQDRISNYMATIGNLLKSTFQIVRELKILEERLGYYEKSKEGNEEAEMTLKGLWVDLVEGGAENPSSVLGLARKAGFIIIPDLFFKTALKKESDMDQIMKQLEEQGINKRVRTVLGRKLLQYYGWKKRTEKELTVRFHLLLTFLRQQYNSVKMYAGWVKPLLRNVSRLEMSGEGGPDMVKAFDSSEIKLELLAIKKEYFAETDLGQVKREFKNVFPCIRATFKFLTIPEMAFHKDYQRGAIHAGKMIIKIEGFSATKEQIEEYKKKKEDEDYELLKTIDASWTMMEEDLKYFFDKLEKLEKERKRGKERPVEKKEEKERMYDLLKQPFTGVWDGIKEIFDWEKSGGGKEDKMTKQDEAKEKGASGIVKANVYLLYDVYKKAHNMLSW